MSKSNNILLIIPSLGVGGAERAICDLSILLSDAGHKVLICHFDNQMSPPFKYKGELISLNVKTGSAWILKIWAFFQRVRRMKKVKRQHKIDVAISFLEGADFINVLSRQSDKVIVSVRSSKIHWESNVGRFKVLRSKILIPWLYNKADCVVVNQRNIGTELSAVFGINRNRIVVIPNSYNATELLRAATENNAGPQSSGKVIVCSGRLDPIKGFLEFIEVFAQVKERLNNTKLWILGDGPLLEALQLKLNERQISFIEIRNEDFSGIDQYEVVFLGARSNPWRFVKVANCFVLASRTESFPNAMAEAIILDVPVAATDCPYGPRELLTGVVSDKFKPTSHPEFYPTGILMPLIKPDTVMIWTDTLCSVLSNGFENNNKRQQARNEFIKKYDRDNVLKHWNTLFA